MIELEVLNGAKRLGGDVGCRGVVIELSVPLHGPFPSSKRFVTRGAVRRDKKDWLP